MDERQPAPPPERARFAVRFVVRFAEEDDLGAARGDGVDLDPRRGHGHHDQRPAAQPLRRERDALRVVAGRRGDHATLQGFRRQRRHLVVRAAQLEGEDGLHVLALQKQRVFHPGRERRGFFQRRLQSDVVDAGIQNALEVTVAHVMTHRIIMRWRS